MRFYQFLCALISVVSVVSVAKANAEIQIQNCQSAPAAVIQEAPYFFVFKVENERQRAEILSAVSRMKTLTIVHTQNLKNLKVQSLFLTPTLYSGVPSTYQDIQAEIRAMIQAVPFAATIRFSCNYVMSGLPKAGGAN